MKTHARYVVYLVIAAIAFEPGRYNQDGAEMKDKVFHRKRAISILIDWKTARGSSKLNFIVPADQRSA